MSGRAHVRGWFSQVGLQFGVLGVGDFRLLFLGQGISELGDWMNRVALIVLVHNLTGQPAAIALLMLAQLLPRALILPVGGVLADRWPKRRLMIGTDLLRAIASTGFVLAPALPTPTLALTYIYGLMIGLQVLTSLFKPARSAAIPALVAPERLGPANATIGIASQMAMLVGPALGGLVLLGTGVNGVFLVNAATFLVSAVFLWAMRLAEPGSGHAQRRSILADLREGGAVVRGNAILQACIAGFALVGAANLCLQVTMVDLLTTALGRPAETLGVLLTLVGLGMLAGTWPTAWALQHFGPILLLGTSVALLGLDTLAIGITASFVLAAAAFAANGILTAMADITSETTIGRIAPSDRVGRVFGLHQWVLTLGHIAGVIGGGVLPFLIGTHATVVGFGGVVAALGLLNALRVHGVHARNLASSR
jgi:MFS family permease